MAEAEFFGFFVGFFYMGWGEVFFLVAIYERPIAFLFPIEFNLNNSEMGRMVSAF